MNKFLSTYFFISLMKLNKLDKQIMEVLIEDARLSFRRIAKQLGVSTATVIKHVEDLEKKGIIKGYSANIDHQKLGYDFKCAILVNLSEDSPEVMQWLLASKAVICVYEMTGEYDMVVYAIFRTRENLDKFLKELRNYKAVQNTETKLILNTIKEKW